VRPPSPPAPSRYEQDLTRLEDEQLVALAQGGGDLAARDELVGRSLPVVGRLVGRSAARSGLQEADRQDARQAAVLWILEAVERYRTYRTGTDSRPAACPFRGFLHRVVSARLVDFLRHRRHLRRHFPLAEAGLLDRNEDSDGRRHRGQPGAGGGSAGPQGEVEQEEVRRLVDQELAGFGEADRTLWDLTAAGTPLRQVAEALHLSYHQAKRHRQKLIARLQSSLAEPRASRAADISLFPRPESSPQTKYFS
jgi:RNA polymerase sigma factor (sigma-70 family)